MVHYNTTDEVDRLTGVFDNVLKRASNAVG